ncbi:MAG: M20/M25/M40 family metallo-hydrolase, partial [Actinomycetota bacterium]
VTHRRMISGAGHDACYVAAHHPTAMIFVPCEDGLSHNEAEAITADQAAAGASVLLGAVREAAGSA